MNDDPNTIDAVIARIAGTDQSEAGWRDLARAAASFWLELVRNSETQPHAAAIYHGFWLAFFSANRSR